jgi:hypothetical protein
MISRKTLYSFLLAVLLLGCIKAYTLRLTNPCDAYLAGQAQAPETVVVNQNGIPYQVPCNQWFLRQPRAVQALCFFEGVLVVVFLVSAYADWRRRRTF